MLPQASAPGGSLESRWLACRCCSYECKARGRRGRRLSCETGGDVCSTDAGVCAGESVRPPGVDLDEVTEEMVLPGSNIVVGPYAGHAQIKQVEYVKSSARPSDCPKDDRPEFAIVGRSNVGKSSLVNALVRKKEIALTSKKPGKTQVINHFLVNKSWYIVDLPGYGFANAPDSVRMDWSAFTKGYFLKRKTLVSVLLLVDASTPPQQIDLDCANWLGRNDIGMTFVFTKCDKRKAKKGNQPDENIRSFLQLTRKYYKVPPPWIMTSSVTGFGRDDLLLHMSSSGTTGRTTRSLSLLNPWACVHI
ncbi:unnamed protein product [Spirodela intermedia]|uniref:EngB-type G domain-containing protein n=1 Tax=Spirodela intermedia TaxID=51605 RepID=A0A7I8IZ03_SPIIN|nr:unnamed protein product [Spirodela intermedia]CAA6663029.1 unnamed protein product [Spirodela intermedia]